MDPFSLATFDSSDEVFTSLPPMDDSWEEFLAAASTKERPSELSLWQTDEDWESLSPIEDLWAEFMSPTATDDHPFEPSLSHTDQEWSTNSEPEDSFDLGTSPTPPAIVGGSEPRAVTMDDGAFWSLSGTAPAPDDEPGDIDSKQSQSPASTATGSPLALSLDLSRRPRCYSQGLLRGCVHPILSPDCKGPHSQPESDSLAAIESYDRSDIKASSPRHSRLGSRRATYGRGINKSYRRKKTTQSHTRKRKSSEPADCEFVPPGAIRKQYAVGELGTPDIPLGSTCLRMYSLAVRFPDEFMLYLFNRHKKQWVCKGDLSTDTVDAHSMSYSANTWGKRYMEVSIYVDDQRVCFRWDDSAQRWMADNIDGNRLCLEHELLLKLVKEPLDRVWSEPL